MTPSVTIKEGNIIKDGYDSQVDEYRDAIKNGDRWINEIEEKEREATGIKNLKVGYNRIFGYYIEVTKSYLDKVPYRYARKQTLAACERFITPELKDVETKKLSASEKCEKTRVRTICCSERRDFGIYFAHPNNGCCYCKH